MRRLHLVLISAFFLASCSSKSSGDGSTTATDSTDGADSGDGADALDGIALDTVGGGDAGDTAVVAPKCTANTDCGADEVCDCLGVCVPAGIAGLPECIEDQNCGSDNYCDTCARVCRPQVGLCEPCTSESGCLDGGACVDFASGGRFCLRECVSDIGCPAPAFKCKTLDGEDKKQCQPQTGACSLSGECTTDGDCEFGEVCNQGLCGAGCQDDTACPEPKICNAFRCTDPCSDTAPCPGEQICVEGHCKIEGGCLSPAECPEPETYCDMAQKLCVPGCLQDFDCKSSKKECSNGKCVDKGCTANYICAFEQVCALDTGKCEKAQGPYCEAGCDPESETSCGGKPNRCLQLQDKDGNDIGTFCFVACLPGETNRCPQGYQCIPLEDDKGNVEGEICHRDCTKTPLAP